MTATADTDRTDARPAEDDGKPDSPAEMKKPSWRYVARKTAREFSKDQCTDLAAALTYYTVLAMFPAFIALISLIGLFGQGPKTVATLLDILRQLGAGSAASTLEPTLTGLANQPSAAGVAFAVGLASALWSASGFVGAFSRAMNRVYEIGEGRPVWKLRPVLLLVTLVELLLVAAVLLALVLTGPAAAAVGGAIGVGSTALTVWNIAKWPVMLLVVVVVVALLYWATPNIEQPRFRWLSIGAAVAIGAWVVASILFGFYVGNFSSYNKTYGSLAGVVVFLLWVWITNLALLFGAELDAELERGRELQAGIPAEETVQLPPRDDRNIKKQEEKEAEDVARGRALRQSRGETQDADASTEDGASTSTDDGTARRSSAGTPTSETSPVAGAPGADRAQRDSPSASAEKRHWGLLGGLLGALVAGSLARRLRRRAGS